MMAPGSDTLGDMIALPKDLVRPFLPASAASLLVGEDDVDAGAMDVEHLFFAQENPGSCALIELNSVICGCWKPSGQGTSGYW